MVRGCAVSPSCGHLTTDFMFVCLFFADTLVLEPVEPVVDMPSETKVNLQVEVVTSSEATALYSVDVPKGSTLLEALGLLRDRSVGFTWVHVV